MSTRYAALFRGINVGGKNIVAMKDLMAMFTAAGCKDVQTYIQSGNVVFSAPDRLAAKLTAVIEGQLPFKTTVILRNLAEMQEAAGANPYSDLDNCHIVFLAGLPSAEQVDELDHNRCPPDRFSVVGKHIYLHLPNGMGNTKLTNAYFDSKLKTVSTARNWRTFEKLLAMMAG